MSNEDKFNITILLTEVQCDILQETLPAKTGKFHVFYPRNRKRKTQKANVTHSTCVKLYFSGGWAIIAEKLHLLRSASTAGYEIAEKIVQELCSKHHIQFCTECGQETCVDHPKRYEQNILALLDKEEEE